MTSWSRIPLAALTLLLPAAVPAQNRVANGSFESPGMPFPGITLSAGSTFITGWTVSQCNIDYGGLGWLSADGAYSIDLNGNTVGGNCGIGGIFQDVAGLSVGSRYDLSFAMAGNPGPSLLDKTLLVLWGPVGGPVQTHPFTFVQNGWTVNNMGWTTMSETGLLASATTMRLEFRSTTPLDPAPGSPGSCCAGPTLDNVALVNAVPEPGTETLLSAGLSVLAAATWVRGRVRRTSSAPASRTKDER